MVEGYSFILKVLGVLKYTVSDHYLVFTILSFKKDTTPGKILHKRNYDKMDTEAFLNELMLSQLYNIVTLSDNIQNAFLVKNNR